MYKKTVRYTDFDGNERVEDFYFNLTKAECTEMELSVNGRLTTVLEKIIKEQDQTNIIKYFKKIMLKAYGEKSPDGRRFIKNDELTEAFTQTMAYSKIFMELAQDANTAAEFVNGILPQDLVSQVQQKAATEQRIRQAAENLVSVVPATAGGTPVVAPQPVTTVMPDMNA